MKKPKHLKRPKHLKKPNRLGKFKKVFTRRRVLNAMLAVCVAVMLFSGYMIYENLSEYKRGADFYTDLGGGFLSEPDAPPAAASAAPADTPDPAYADPLAPDEPPPEPDESAKPNYVDTPAPDVWPVVDFAGLSEINSEVTAWLRCGGTNIDYPVAQGADNSYYLTHLFNRNQNKAGTLFIDSRNKPGFTDANTIIYGHNMRNHSMFWTLTRYKSQAFFNSHPTMKLITPDGNYVLELFAGYVANPQQEDAWQIRFASAADFESWLETARARSSFTSGVSVTAADRVVTLSTCSYEFSDARYILVGKLVPTTGVASSPVFASSPAPSAEPTPEFASEGGEPVAAEPPSPGETAAEPPVNESPANEADNAEPPVTEPPDTELPDTPPSASA
ncbi:MAG: class B sortase [Oscillospiraceae bacterium]|nr:class B sortase [Oscillospiraceae bacterium]